MKKLNKSEILYDYIVVEGNIGSGKTTFSNMAAAKNEGELDNRKF
jgi:hypothetical protein